MTFISCQCRFEVMVSLILELGVFVCIWCVELTARISMTWRMWPAMCIMRTFVLSSLISSRVPCQLIGNQFSLCSVSYSFIISFFLVASCLRFVSLAWEHWRLIAEKLRMNLDKKTMTCSLGFNVFYIIIIIIIIITIITAVIIIIF